MDFALTQQQRTFMNAWIDGDDYELLAERLARYFGVNQPMPSPKERAKLLQFRVIHGGKPKA